MTYLALVVEDEAPLRTLYEIVLKGSGFHVLHAADGQQAINILAEHTPNLLLLDMLLPKVNGSEVMDYVQTTPRLQSTGIVIVTAHERFNDVEDKVLFLLKPVRPDDIKQAACQILAAHSC
jgi:CheY-like chemotaxis protein